MGEERSCFQRREGLSSLFSLVLTPLILSLLAGCEESSKLGHVHGTVRLDGKPLTTGTVRFVPEAGRAASGLIQSDGSFALGTYGQSDGALIGRHKVAIVAFEAGTYDRPAYEIKNQKGKPLVPERYMAVGTSGLTFEVKSGDNPADFDLATKSATRN